jgi:hypothetical protein
MTLNQRRQALDFGKFCGTGMHIPSGMIQVAARAHILNIYYEVPVVNPFYFWRNKNIIGGSWTSKATPSSSWSSKQSPSTGWTEKLTPQDGNTQVI